MGTVTLLWTGGWDSTFRLLQLLHDTEARVQPLYLVDDERRSTPRELEAMREIRTAVEEGMSDAGERLLPTEYGSYRATAMEPHHRAAWEALKKRARVGLQYPILASHAEQHGIRGLELSIVARPADRRSDAGDSAPGLASILAPLVESHPTPAGPVPALPEGLDGPESLFSRFRFPLLRHTKTRMWKDAAGSGWMPIMNLTWFCFSPRFRHPCGVCHPCTVARQTGMGHRVGYLGPMLSRAARFRNHVRGWFGASRRS